ncbi:aminotransferase class V-fold PLP-dependent enzyme [Marinitenerispora sediminis]|uniref:Probable hercynylcysteine sulfoxide lyase n=1 Tax=Marinitenerispora sediminis TaxID=1931232 RepID=A0A368T8S0_9ACTN|nr:aminotransferase class V-fold PLP-dependent enzyme [Marinitenerispora sediminis]RCV52077.1 aminotransferase [Marinitenerispora sediminis]RCV58096.1 aminotransferase [Marinitenerispora sediminis]RCV60842.1 aminotransferase [Marinitenerispora sediminis]
MIDPERAAADTPGCRGGGIFLDSAGSSLPPRDVLETVIGHLRREAEVGGYRAARERADDLEEGYGVFAEILGCAPEEIAFTDSATRSWLSVFNAVPLAAGDRVLITEAEYAGNAIPILRRAESVGAGMDVVPSTPEGDVSVEALEGMLDERVKLVSLVHAPTNGGLLTSVRAAAAAARRAGAYVLLDACQSLGQVPVRADELDVDFITGTGRKWMRGPRGTGFLYARRAVLDGLVKDSVDLHGGTWAERGLAVARDDARVFELWEASIADRLGLVAAGRYLLDLGVDEVHAAVRAVSGRLRTGLASIAGVRVHDIGVAHSGIVSFSVDGVPAPKVAELLVERGVTVTVSRRASTRIDMERRGLAEVVRASPHYFVSPAQVDAALEVVEAVRG